MPFALRETPDALAPDDLDDSWARGWFRMRQTLFTTHFLEFDGQFFSAVWLRVALSSWGDDARFRELKKRNLRFRVEFQKSPAVPGPELEDLFARYREALDIEVAPTLADLLVGWETTTVYDTWEVRLFDGELLIAAGIFDRGQRAAAGITAFYDPLYRKQSLGRYLIYLKMEFCRDHGLEWFYPGYFVPGRPRFDYKLDIASAQLQYLDLASGEWLPWDPKGPRPDPLATMVERLALLGRSLWYNRHLSIHLSPQIRGVELFDFPVFVNALPEGWPPGSLIVVFDPRDDLFHLLLMRSVYRVEASDSRPPLFESDLLQVDRLLYSTPHALEMRLTLDRLHQDR